MGFMYSDQLSDVLRCALQPMTRFRQMADAKDATTKGLHSGDLFHWNVYSDVVTQGAALTEGTVMPETNYAVSQGTLTVTEYGNSVPFSSKLDDLSYHPVKEVIQKVLKNDANKALDSAAYTQFNATPLRVAPTAGNSATSVTLTTNGATTITNAIAMGTAHVKATVDIMKERNIAAVNGQDYFCIGWPTTFRTFKNQLETLHQYVDKGFQFILNGEIGRYEGVRSTIG